MPKDKYPECTKINALQTELRTLRNFLTWLADEKKYEILEYDDGTVPPESNEELFAQFLGIDGNKVETERQQMIQELQLQASAQK
ncbi:hypothetical protein LCGC14_1968490 [marine sediment metagenome]|uniref:Uncharacterized protein n=1 Tax=marine sediment metagenome TaxID=412755 RepID=A0A0F9FCF6_9ZZZZ